MKDIKTAKQFYKLFTDKELTVLSIEQKMQLYAEYYHKAKIEAISDEEISKECNISDSVQFTNGFDYGAKWFKNKLLNDL